MDQETEQAELYDVIWTVNDPIENLLICLNQKDLTAVRFLYEQTKEDGKVAYALAMDGKVVSLAAAALLMVAAKKVITSETAIYHGVIKETLSLGSKEPSFSGEETGSTNSKNETSGKRECLLCEMDLLQLYGAMAQNDNADKKVISPLILASKVLIFEDPNDVYVTTDMKESPLFYAVRNGHTECVKTLLHCGAHNEGLNIRKQRPIDFAKSQDMRFILNPINISSACSTQRKYASVLQIDGVFSEACKPIPEMRDVDPTTERTSSSTKTQNCKYFESPGGCVRDNKCFYAHCKEIQNELKGFHLRKADLTRKIFVGGLPPALDSESLSKYFEQFGLVEDAKVIGVLGNEKQSQGFGFVTCVLEKSVATAIQAHYVCILGKQVEIESVIPKSLILVRAQEKTCSTLTRSRDNLNPASMKSYEPAPLRTFKKWLPTYKAEVNAGIGQGQWYALSFVKVDFKAQCGVELDHSSLGYSKLSKSMIFLPILEKPTTKFVQQKPLVWHGTVLIAVKTEEGRGIVIFADRKVTCEHNDGAVSYRYEPKLFVYGDIVIGGAGNQQVFNRGKFWFDKSQDYERLDISEIAEKLKKFMNERKKKYEKTSILLSGFLKGSAKIYNVTTKTVTGNFEIIESEKNYTSLGCGAVYASSFLDKYCAADDTYELSIETCRSAMIKAIYKCPKSCGGEIDYIQMSNAELPKRIMPFLTSNQVDKKVEEVTNKRKRRKTLQQNPSTSFAGF